MGVCGVTRSVSGVPWLRMATMPCPCSFTLNSPPEAMPATRLCMVTLWLTVSSKASRSLPFTFSPSPVRRRTVISLPWSAR